MALSPTFINETLSCKQSDLYVFVWALHLCHVTGRTVTCHVTACGCVCVKVWTPCEDEWDRGGGPSLCSYSVWGTWRPYRSSEVRWGSLTVQDSQIKSLHHHYSQRKLCVCSHQGSPAEGGLSFTQRGVHEEWLFHDWACYLQGWRKVRICWRVCSSAASADNIFTLLVCVCVCVCNSLSRTFTIYNFYLKITSSILSSFWWYGVL